MPNKENQEAGRFAQEKQRQRHGSIQARHCAAHVVVHLPIHDTNRVPADPGTIYSVLSEGLVSLLEKVLVDVSRIVWAIPRYLLAQAI